MEARSIAILAPRLEDLVAALDPKGVQELRDLGYAVHGFALALDHGATACEILQGAATVRVLGDRRDFGPRFLTRALLLHPARSLRALAPAAAAGRLGAGTAGAMLGAELLRHRAILVHTLANPAALAVAAAAERYSGIPHTSGEHARDLVAEARLAVVRGGPAPHILRITDGSPTHESTLYPESDTFQLRLRRRPPDTARPIVVSVAPLEPASGIEVLVRAFAIVAERYPKMTVHVIGHGSQRTDLEELAIGFGLMQRVRFHTRLEQRAARLIVDRAAVFVAAQHSRGDAAVVEVPEPVLEAMAMGVPVIAALTPGVEALLRDGESALLVRDGDAHALAHAIRRLLEDDALRDTLISGARRVIDGMHAKYCEANSCPVE